MALGIDLSQTGNRRVRLSARFNDQSGHVDIMDMLEDYDSKDWSQSDVVHSALVLLLDEWRKGDTHPLSPTAEYVSSEMLEMVKKAHKALDRTNEILNLVLSGGINTSNAGDYQKEISEIKSDIDINIVEGAGNYAGEISINDEDDTDFGDWD